MCSFWDKWFNGRKNKEKTPTTKILSEDEYIKELCKKTQEELTEYIEAKTKPDKLEELSDLLELVNALAEHEGTTLERNQQHP